MALSREAQQALRRLTQELVSRISELVSNETAAAIDDALRDRLAAMTADLPPPPPPPPPPSPASKRRVGARRFGSRATVERLVDVIKIAGGTATPGVVSKALGLSPERRRALVAKAVAAGLVRTEGERRRTVYVLV